MARILSIASYKFLKPTNGGQWGIHFCETINAMYNEVHVLSTENNDTTFNTTYQLHNKLSNSTTRYIPFLISRQLDKLVISLKPTHIYCHHPYLFPAAFLVAKKHKLPIYIRSHNIESVRFKTVGKWWWKLMFYFEKFTFKNADLVFLISKEDRDWALTNYKLNPEKAKIVPVPTPFNAIPQASKSKIEIANLHQLNKDKKWLIFMGLLDYQPNEEAVKLIVDEIYPRLKQANSDFEILICGKGLKQVHVDTINRLEHIHYLGFVDDLDSVLYHSHIMLNPVLTGGGVKTKILEALAWNTYVVSTHFGAYGVDPEFCGGKLVIVPNADWDYFVNKVITYMYKPKNSIPNTFFDNYSIDAVSKKNQRYFEA